MNRFMAALAVASLLVLASYGASIEAQDNQSTILFRNNTSDPLSLVVDKESSYRCRVFVRNGSCTTFVTPGERFVQAVYDDGEVAADDTLTVKAGEEVPWTIVDADE